MTGTEAKLAIHGGPRAAADLAVPEWPRVTDRTRDLVNECLDGGRWCRLYEGSWAERFEGEFAEYQDAGHAIAVGNGTVALELALRTCDVRPGDEVLVPSYTFIATASAVACMGAVPRFVDVDPDTYNVDPDALEAAITDRTVGVVGVHFAGYPIDFDEILPIVREHDLFLIEDAAHAQGSEWKGRKVGTIGHVGTFSFQESKSLPGGEGGMVVTDDAHLAERARLLHNIGRRQDDLGYTHYVLSSNYRMPELSAALLLGQLEKLPEENERRRRNEAVLGEGLAEIDGIETKPEDDRITGRGYVSFNFRYDPEAFAGVGRDRLVEALSAEGVPAGTGYEIPLYRQPAFRRGEFTQLLPPGTDVPAYGNIHHPGAEEICRTSVSLPHRVLLAGEEGMEAIVDAVRKVKRHAGKL